MPVRAVITTTAVMRGRMSVMPPVTVVSMVLRGLRDQTPGTSPQPQARESPHNQREFLRHDGISGHRFDQSPAQPGQEQPDKRDCTRHAKPQKHLFSRESRGFPAADCHQSPFGAAPPTPPPSSNRVTCHHSENRTPGSVSSANCHTEWVIDGNRDPIAFLGRSRPRKSALCARKKPSLPHAERMTAQRSPGRAANGPQSDYQP